MRSAISSVLRRWVMTKVVRLRMNSRARDGLRLGLGVGLAGEFVENEDGLDCGASRGPASSVAFGRRKAWRPLRRRASGSRVAACE